MGFCGKCGNKIEDGEKFCSNCGANIEEKEHRNIKKERIKKTEGKKRIIPFLIILIIIFGCTFVWLIGSQNTKESVADVQQTEFDDHEGVNEIENDTKEGEKKNKKLILKSVEQHSEYDDSWSKSEYDIHGNIIKSEGKIFDEYRSTEYVYSEENELLMMITKYFDVNDNLLSEESVFYFSEYDDKGLLTTQMSQAYDTNGIYIGESKYYYEYDINGNKLKYYEIFYNSNGEIEDEWYYEWNNQIKRWCQNEWRCYESGEIIWKYVTEWDEYGNIIRNTVLYRGQIVDTEYIYEYIYDENGNVLECYEIVEIDGEMKKKLSYKCDYEFDENGNKLVEYRKHETEFMVQTIWYTYYE